MGKITTHLSLLQCQQALTILRSKASLELQFKKLKAAKLTNTVTEMPTPRYFRALEQRMARRVGVPPLKKAAKPKKGKK
jgi:hypothetical protein